MNHSLALIVGIDPGTTVGLAIVSISGEIKEIYSKRELSLAELINKVYSTGIPVVCSTDKKKVPAFILRFAAKTGARVISPDADLTVIEKREIIHGIGVGNSQSFAVVDKAKQPIKGFLPGGVDIKGIGLKYQHFRQFFGVKRLPVFLPVIIGIMAAIIITEGIALSLPDIIFELFHQV